MGTMSPRQHKKLHFGFFYIILAPIALVLINKQKWMQWWTQGSYGFGRQLVQNQVSLPCKMSQFLGDFTRQTWFIYIDFNRAFLIFTAKSGPFWQEAEALKEHCFCFQPSSVKCHNF